MHNGLDLNMGSLPLLSNAQSRSISAENPTGARGMGGQAAEGFGQGAARDLGQGWKVAPALPLGPGQTVELADIEGPGAIQQFWIGFNPPTWRFAILRIYWDGEETPSVETPAGDFFCCGWNRYATLNSLAICVNPFSALNSYWQMPFRGHCRITVENIGDAPTSVYYQINYTLTDVPVHAAYFHAQFHRTNPVPYKEVHTILEDVRGKGHYVGAYLAWGTNNNGWWGEGEIKFYMDGEKWPTICGTGTEDYFCGAHCFSVNGRYQEYSTPYAGFHQVIRPDGVYDANTRFGMYRWHIMDPVRFEQSLRVTIQALGWRRGGRYHALQDDLASVAYWYQAEPHAAFPPMPTRDELEVI